MPSKEAFDPKIFVYGESDTTASSIVIQDRPYRQAYTNADIVLSKMLARESAGLARV